jgi:magnesium transporter
MILWKKKLVKVKTTDDQEHVAQLFLKYDLLSAPVVDQENRLVGIITVDDIVDIIEEEATEDFEKMAAMVPSERPYLKTSVFTHAKNRFAWLMVLMISGMITGQILGRFESAFSALPLLVTFIPQLMNTGGNAGSQSSTLVIRGMAVSEIYLKDFLRVLWKELRISLLVGIVLSLVNYIRIILFLPASSAVAITVSIALFATVIIAKTIGGVLPMAARYFKLDPAIMASPLITTIVDAFALIIYFAAAERILHL